MAWKYRDFECACGTRYERFVDDRTNNPGTCPACGSAGATLLPVLQVRTILSYVPDYPGANQHRAGFANLRRPAEKAGSQVSMYGTAPVAPKTPAAE